MSRLSVYIITFFLATTSIIYELVLAQTLSILSGNTVLWFSLTIGFFLGSMGLGSLYYKYFFKKNNYCANLINVEILLIIAGSLGVLFIYGAHLITGYLLYKEFAVAALVLFPVWSFLVITIIGFLTGIELPLLFEIGAKTAQKPIYNKILALDYVGSFIGALLFPLILVLLFSSVTIGILAALVNTLVLLFIAYHHKVRGIIAIYILMCAIIPITLLAGSNSISTYLKNYYYYKPVEGIGLLSYLSHKNNTVVVERSRSQYQTIDIVRGFHGEYHQKLIEAYSIKNGYDSKYPADITLFLDGDFQFLSDTSKLHHEWFAHIPVILAQNTPKHILILGGGDGLLAKELLKYDAVISITLVELDPSMIKVAKTNEALLYMNSGALSDPRVNIIIDDAFSFVRHNNETFDAIYLDFPHAKNHGVARLYSKEFYAITSSLLKPDGFMVISAPGIEPVSYIDQNYTRQHIIGQQWSIYFHTLRAVGLETIIPFHSLLEDNNAKALALIKKDLCSSMSWLEKDKQARIILGDYAESITNGFIFAQKKPLANNPAWKPLDISLHLLNENRFEPSLLPYSQPKYIDFRKINSIIQPTILDMSLRPRFP